MRCTDSAAQTLSDMTCTTGLFIRNPIGWMHPFENIDSLSVISFCRRSAGESKLPRIASGHVKQTQKIRHLIGKVKECWEKVTHANTNQICLHLESNKTLWHSLKKFLLNVPFAMKSYFPFFSFSRQQRQLILVHFYAQVFFVVRFCLNTQAANHNWYCPSCPSWLTGNVIK